MSTRFPVRSTLPPVTAQAVRRLVDLIVCIVCLTVLVAGGGYGVQLLFPPQAVGLMLTRDIPPGAFATEMRVFDVGEPLVFSYTIARSRAGHSLGVAVTKDGESIATNNLVRQLEGDEGAQQRVLFTPSAEGLYRAVLVVDGTAVEGEEIAFKVISGGTRLRSVVSARSIDGASYTPVEVAEQFTTRDTVHIAYAVAQARTGDTVGVVYSVNGTTLPTHPQDTSTLAGGDFRGFFAISATDEEGLVVGDYRADVFYNGDLVAVVRFIVDG